MATDADVLKDAQEAFSEAQERLRPNRDNYADDIKFALLEEQWPTKMRARREFFGRPCLTTNRLKTFIHQVTNDARLNKPAIACFPVDDDGDPKTAEVLDGLIRHIEQSSRADAAYDHALMCAVAGGFGFFRVNLTYARDDNWDQDIVIERVMNPLSVWWDPDSEAADSSDWNVAFVTDKVPKRAFERKYKDAAPVDWSSDEWPAGWREGEEILTAEYWTRDEVTREIVLLTDGRTIDRKDFEKGLARFQAQGIDVIGQPRAVKSHKVTQRLITGKDVLETVDWAGRWIPIIPVWGEEVIDPEGRRHFVSLIRSAKDEQRRFNIHSSTVSELIGLQPKVPYIGPKGSFASDEEKWATANTDNHAFIEYDPVVKDGVQMQPPQRQGGAPVPVAELQAAMSAADNMKAIIGIYDASLGAPSNEKSGKAIQARQREGDVASFHFVDNLSRAISHAGRVLVDLIPHAYPAPRVIRTLGRDETEQRIPVNQPFRVQEQTEDGQVREIERIYDLTTGKYDVTVKAGPSFSTRREETVANMLEFIRVNPAAAPVLSPELMRLWDTPNATELATKLEAAMGQGPAAEQAKQALQRLAGMLQQSQAKVAELQADRSVDAFNAETNRIKAFLTKDNPLGPAAAQQLVPVVAQALQLLLNSPDILDGAPAPGQRPAPMAPPGLPGI